MDPLTVGLALGAVSAIGSGVQGLMNRSAAKKQARAYQDAINLMREQMARQYDGLYGANATASSMSTGDPYQDYLLRLLAEEAQAKELQAARINLAKANMTDLEAQREAFIRLLAQSAGQNSQALANAGIQSRRMGMGNAGQLLWQAAKSRAKDANSAYNQSRFYNNDNLARIGAGANLNTGSVADQNRQMAQNLYATANQNYQAAANNLGNLMTAQNQAKANVPTYGGILGSAALSGLTNGAMGYLMAGAGQGQSGGQQSQNVQSTVNAGKAGGIGNYLSSLGYK